MYRESRVTRPGKIRGNGNRNNPFRFTWFQSTNLERLGWDKYHLEIALGKKDIHVAEQSLKVREKSMPVVVADDTLSLRTDVSVYCMAFAAVA